MSDRPETTDAWAECQAETLADVLSRVSLLIFHYPRELTTAGKVRAGIDEMVRELKAHAQEMPDV